MKNLLKIMLAASLCISASFAAPQKGTMKDPRDGKTYKTVKIGDQVWMAENLAFEIEGNAGSRTCLNPVGKGNKVKCKKYGRYYDQYYSAIAALKVACPDGWHLPSAAELKKMLDFAGNSIDLKSKKGWNTYQQPSGNGKDKYGFNAQPSGTCMILDGKCAYMDEGNYAYFWTSSMQSDPLALVYAFLGAPHADYGFDVSPIEQNFWYPVRCIQDEEKNVGDDLMKNLKFSKNIDQVLKDVARLQTTGKTSDRRSKADGGSNDGGRGVGDGLAGLLNGSGGGIEASQKGAMTDSRDGKKYKTVAIGKQIWMAENLNYKTAYSYCYEDKASNCAKYGRLYIWEAALKACPIGWHLPSKEDFDILVDAVGGIDIAGRKLKSAVSWNENGNGSDEVSFVALPAGYMQNYGRKEKGGYYKYEGSYAGFHSSTGAGSEDAFGMHLGSDSDDADLGISNVLNGFSVRCLKD